MKNKIIIKKLFIWIGILCFLGFCVRFGADLYKISVGLDDTPVYLLALERILELILPGVVCLGVAGFLKKRT